MNLDEENASLKAALAIYAEPKNWSSTTTGHGESEERSFNAGPIYKPGYTVARKALGLPEPIEEDSYIPPEFRVHLDYMADQMDKEMAYRYNELIKDRSA